MIYWRPEGKLIKNGINLYINFKLTRFWFSIILKRTNNSIYFFRFRTFMKPHFIYNKQIYGN